VKLFLRGGVGDNMSEVDEVKSIKQEFEDELAMAREIIELRKNLRMVLESAENIPGRVVLKANNKL
jgi:hypothetical protein